MEQAGKMADGGEVIQAAAPPNMAAPTYQFPPPPPMSFRTPAEWPTWRKRFERFRKATGLAKQPEEEQVNALILAMGPQADDILSSFHLTAEQEEGYSEVINRFEAHFVIKKNRKYEKGQVNARVKRR